MNPEGRQKILIVDDNVTGKLLGELLEANYSTCFASTGKLALEMAISQRPDLILLETFLPEMDGYEVCRQLKACEKTQEIPVMFISEQNGDDETRGLELGAVDYITKPFRSALVLARVRNLLRVNGVLQPKTISQETSLQNEMRLQRLVDILQHPSETIQEFLDYSLMQAIQLTESKIGYIYHYHEDRKEFILNTWSKEVMAECAVEHPQTSYDLEKTGIWGEAVRQRRPIMDNAFQAAHPLKKGYPKGHVHLSKFLTVPIFKNDLIVGVVGLANKEADYDETDILQVSLLLEAVWTVTDRMKAEAALRESEEKFKKIIETSPDGIAISAMDGTVQFVTSKGLSMWGYDSMDELVGRNVLEFVHENYREKAICLITRMIEGDLTGAAEYLMVRQDGSEFYCEANANVLRDARQNPIGILYIERDITERKRLEEEMRQLAITDQLTNVHNRRKLDQVFVEEKKRADRYAQALSVIIVDIDHFKSVNDLHGHQVGDMILSQVAKLLGAGLREADILGRWGGDEFMVICPFTDLEGAGVLAEKLRQIVEDSAFAVVGKQTCSFGLAQLAKDESIDAMVARADAALYRAKDQGRNRVEG